VVLLVLYSSTDFDIPSFAYLTKPLANLQINTASKRETKEYTSKEQVIDFPAHLMITSAGRIPAAAAGEPNITCHLFI